MKRMVKKPSMKPSSNTVTPKVPRANVEMFILAANHYDNTSFINILSLQASHRLP